MLISERIWGKVISIESTNIACMMSYACVVNNNYYYGFLDSRLWCSYGMPQTNFRSASADSNHKKSEA